jgi:hypothetical protein
MPHGSNFHCYDAIKEDREDPKAAKLPVHTYLRGFRRFVTFAIERRRQCLRW